jgi:(E)-4-hydroxy-3-methylbut-2-enyl-diphosphate synthase
MITKNNISRFPTREIIIGDRPLGGVHPIRLQSMTSTNTLDVKATAAQCIRIIEAGADYVRISAPSVEAAHKLKEIKSELRAAGFTNPLVADIHFNPEVALIAATLVEKIRINPGNYTGGLSKTQTSFSEKEIMQHLEQTAIRLKPLVEVCRQQGTAIRIGTNMGSLSPRIVAQYGNTPQAMVQSTFEFLQIFQELGFHNLVVSLKVSKPLTMVQSYEGMVEKMLEHNMNYPLHIGITEAGEGENGRIKSALGICSLLNKGIGDTLRVSLTEDPEFEIPFARTLAMPYQKAFSKKTDNYHLQKQKMSEKAISILDNHCKAIVVESFSEFTKNTFIQNPGEIDYHPITLKNQTTQELSADLVFCDTVDQAETLHGKAALLSIDHRNDTAGENIFPLIPVPSWEQHDRALQQKAFIHIQQPELPLFDFSEYKPYACIVEFNDINDTAYISKIINCFTQVNIPLIIKTKLAATEADECISELAGFAADMLIGKKIQGLWIDTQDLIKEKTKILFGFLQSSGLRITRTEFISCPTCARTSFDLQKVLHDVQKETSCFPGLKIAVMGCVVNGPGEMADADFGYVGAGNGKIHLYKGKTPVRRNIDPKDALATLLELLKEHGY